MYRNIDQLNAVIDSLVDSAPELCTRVFLNNSVQNRQIRALRLRAGGGTNRRGILIVGGMHARELMNPDAIVELAMDLVAAYKSSNGLEYGGASWSFTDVRIMMETLDIWMLPCANPDGRNHVQTVDKLWRMNRRDNPGTTCDGVDPNRNCDFMWRVVGPTTVCDPCSTTQGFVGSLPFSEPEANNIHLLCDTHRIDVFVDVHSFSGFVLFPWGHAPTQTTQPLPNFTTLLMGFCRPLDPPTHQEFMSPSDKTKYETVATRVKNKISAVRGENYVLKTIFQVYGGPTTGTTSDYVYSRHIANPALRKTFAFAFETGPDLGFGKTLESFQPANPDPIKDDTKAGLVELINQSVCAIEFIGTTILGQTVEPISAARDELLEPTELGRGWIEFVDNVQGELLAIVLSDRALTERAMSLLPRVQELAAARDKATVTDKDVESGVEFLESLQSRTKRVEVRDGISTVISHLKDAYGQTVAAVLQKLSKTYPPKL